MNKKIRLAFFLVCSSFLLPVTALAQCKDQLCQNLQNILFAAVIDFREYRTKSASAPELSIEGAKVPCQMSVWANNVPMYICYSQVPSPSAEVWYTSALADLRILQPTWQFKINSPVSDHFVDAGLPDCEIPATGGPNLGHCPLHLQITRQTDGMAKIYLWMSSLSSPYLVKRLPESAKKTVAAPVGGGCDELCQGLKKAFEARVNSFKDLHAAKTTGGVSEPTIKLVGAGECSVNSTLKSRSNDAGTQYVCYWSETSNSAADAIFRDLISRFQILAPSNWPTREEDQSEELTGVKVKAWCAAEPTGKQAVCIYISGESVGLHINSWN